MKRNVLGLFAVVLAIAISSFTVKKFANVYLVYSTSATVEKDLSNYTQQPTSPGTFSNSIPKKLAWFRIVDNNDGIIDATEFDAGFEALDATATASNKLSDEPLSSEGVNLEFR